MCKMKVLQLLLVGSVILMAVYVTIAEPVSKRQAEVKEASDEEQQLLVFGSQLASSSTQGTRVKQKNYRLRKITAMPTSGTTRTSHRRDADEVPPSQLITQYKIPLVREDRMEHSSKSADFSLATRSDLVMSSDENVAATAAVLAQRNSERGLNVAAHSNLNASIVSGSSSETRGNTKTNARRLKSDQSATRTTSATTTTTLRPSIFDNLQHGNPFEIFSQNFWNFSNPQSNHQPTTTTKKPPKKYMLTPPAVSKENKLNHPISKVANKPTKSTVAATSSITSNDNSIGPFKIALPTHTFFNTQSHRKNVESEKDKRATVLTLRERFNCPRESEVRFQLFPKICKTDRDCAIWKRQELCCEIFGAKSCVSGIPKPLEESSHAPILGLIPRKCPTRPLAELWWDVKECDTDVDCWPRLCCPDGRRRYCRTSQPELEIAPVTVKRSFNYLTEYLECTPPPPPIFDLHPKACTSTLDCFPNVCCQEAGLRHCRPPKKSLLTLMANFLNVDLVKRLTQNIVIK